MSLPGKLTIRSGPALARAMLAVMFTLGLLACTAMPRQALTPPALAVAGTVPVMPDADILALSPEMHAFLERYVLPYEDLDTRLDLLVIAVSHAGVLGFSYDDDRSLSAASAFSARAGNCLSFANMLVALAREAGLKAEYQQVYVPREWASVDNTMLLEKHVNVVLGGKRFNSVVDITGENPGSEVRRRVLEDTEAHALHYNNIGVDALLENDLLTAYAYAVKAIHTAPDVAGSWVNLGVILRRNGQLDDAAYAYRAALEIDPSETAALSNLYDIYIDRGDTEAARLVWERVEHYRRENPYYLLKLSDKAIAETRYQDSLELMKRAVRKKENDHQLHFALAKAQYLNGERAAAEESYRRARELAAGKALARYERPLPDLIKAISEPNTP